MPEDDQAEETPEEEGGRGGTVGQGNERRGRGWEQLEERENRTISESRREGSKELEKKRGGDKRGGKKI